MCIFYFLFLGNFSIVITRYGPNGELMGRVEKKHFDHLGRVFLTNEIFSNSRTVLVF